MTIRGNNPGNLEASRWTQSQPGYVGRSGRFAVFDNLANGIAAQARLLGSYISRGYDSVSEIIWRYGNDPGTQDDASVRNYITYVSRRLGVAPTATLSPSQAPQLGQAMREFETDQRVAGVIGGAGHVENSGPQFGITIPGLGHYGDPTLPPDWWNHPEAVDQIGGDIGSAFGALFEPSTWGRVAIVVIGVILIGVALIAFIMNGNNPVASTVKDAVNV